MMNMCSSLLGTKCLWRQERLVLQSYTQVVSAGETVNQVVLLRLVTVEEPRGRGRSTTESFMQAIISEFCVTK
jgi:hypothetical protein